MNSRTVNSGNAEQDKNDGRQKIWPPSESMVNSIVENQERSKRIYHYTSLDSFYKIIDGVKDNHFIFHAGSIYSMNDSQEMTLGYEYIKKTLPQIEDKLHVNAEERISILLNQAEDNTHEAFKKFVMQSDKTNFVVSFSSKPDDLPLWGLYGDNKAGVCLEFSPSMIKKYYKELALDRHIQIMECVYDETEISDFVATEIEVLYRLFLKAIKNCKNKSLYLQREYLAIMCLVVGAFVKHKDFSCEEEIRMNIIKDKSECKFSNTRLGHRRTFVETPIPTSALTKIIIGPVTPISSVRNSLIMRLRAKGITLEPEQSGIPYRQY